MFKKILVPVDGSEVSAELLKYVKSFGETYNADVVLLNAYGLPTMPEYNNYPVYPMENAFTIEKISEEIVQRVRDQLGDVPFNVETFSEAGNPAGVILDAAEKYDCDLIIMCTHGMGAVKRFLLGSVTNKVVHHAHIPVLIIR